MILASGITNYVSFTEIFGEGTIIFAGLRQRPRLA